MTSDLDSSDISSTLIAGETRIRDVDGFVGTVVYIGPVASAKDANEKYAGIVWDDPSRGKHDGSVVCRQTNQVVRHFGGCGPTQGSFIRLAKLDRGVTLTAELLQSKYVAMDAPEVAPNNLLPHVARTSSGRDKPIEFLGEMQIRQRQQLDGIHKISLRREGISRTSPNADFLSTDWGDNIRDVDLAGNLLSNWTEVLRIIQQFPQLTDFSVAYNRIRDVTLPVHNLETMKVLNLNNCHIQSFTTVQWVAQSMPNLEKLCVASSDFSDMESYDTTTGFQYLKVLDCSDCRITSWESQIQKQFSGLPALEQLSLDDNPIPRIPSPEQDMKPQERPFASLMALQLAGTTVSTWNDLEGINSLANIRSLRLKNTPLTSTLGQGEVRFLAIARFPTLEYLNGSVISTQQRTEAERRYVTMVATLEARTEQVRNENSGDKDGSVKRPISLDHPQYQALREKHKGLIIPALQGPNGSNLYNSGNNNIASTVCNVTITSMAASSCSMEPLIRRLPSSLTVGRLKALCARAFGLDVDLMTLHFRTKVRTYTFSKALTSSTKAISCFSYGSLTKHCCGLVGCFPNAYIVGCLSSGIRPRRQCSSLLWCL